ncbi:uncharacterized protein LOC135079316 [Ostrinia nubilalis]|uniref:uncharacterized protein LOC135079316 n=1 Tax=Ostrinia nubilalis TaxID=29057 RepID=UPI0030826B49
MTKLVELKRKRGSYKAKLTHFKTFLDNLTNQTEPSQTQLSDLGLRLSTVESWYGEYDSLQIEIESSMEISETECEREYEYREKFEVEYFAIVGRAREWIAEEDPARIQTLPRYRRAQALITHFWNRYYLEYISDLQKRTKWQSTKGGELRIGDLVVVKDDRLPPNRWLLGRVACLHPGRDSIARVVDVNTSAGVLRRAYNRLCPLP